MSEVRIACLDKQGTGLTDDGALVPYALPGERLKPGPAPEILNPSPERIDPVCRHFGHCGGCALQHQSYGATASWKRSLLVEALAQRRIEAEIEPTITLPDASRRRSVLALSTRGKHTLLGLRASGSHAIVDLGECPILVPEIADALPELRHILAPVAPPARRGGRGSHGGGAASVCVLATETGLDIAVKRPRAAGPIDVPTLSRLAACAADAGWARLTLDGELVAALAEPVLVMGRARVVPPPAAFVQSVVECETILFGAVDRVLHDAKRSLDLFSGVGTFALRMMDKAAVHAVESAPDALAALETAARTATGRKPVTTECRDLFRSPLTAGELRGIDLAVFDPPRAGAEAQAREIAASKVPTVIGVSCNPESFARDAAILIAGGYRLERLTPVDQFRFSPHVECVGTFRR